MKILIADDHECNRELLSYVLEDEGYEYVEAVNGLDACEKCRQDEDIDLVLMDVTMPELDGISATENIKKEHSERFIPIIFVTALDDSEMLAKCLSAGGDDFVPKPINENVLLAKIKAHKRTRDLNLHLQNANKQLEFHKQNMDREHLLVERIYDKAQYRIKTDCLNIQKYTSPASMFNGDIVLEAPSPSGGIYNIVGDFTGHGLAASIGTLPVSELFYRFAAEQASIALIAKEINNSLVELLPDNMFFCAAICYLDHAGKGLSLWIGGMNDVLKVSPNQVEKLTRIPAQHMPLGILAEDEFDETPLLIDLTEGDKVYIFTDGIVEADNKEGEQFGVEKIESVALNGGDGVIDKIIASVRDFQASQEQNDDISIIEVSAGPLQHASKNNPQEIVNIRDEFYASESFPWVFSMRLEDEELANASIVDQIMVFVGGIQGIELHREKVFTIVSELYNNALEHGVLGLSSDMKETADGFEEYYRLRTERLENISGHFIDLKLSFLKDDVGKLEIILNDSGKGFDYESVMEKMGCRKDEENLDSFGRGLPLLWHLCSEMTYSNQGRTVRAVYSLRFS